MKKEENCLRLEEIRTALAEADAVKLSAGVSAQEREMMEEACVTLRVAERRALVNAGKGLVERFRESAGSVNMQAKKIRALVTKMNRIPKRGLMLRSALLRSALRCCGLLLCGALCCFCWCLWAVALV